MVIKRDSNFVIADSSGLISLFLITDNNHNYAKQASQNFIKPSSSLILPNDVYTETINILGRKIGHQEAFGTASYLASTPQFILSDTNNQIRKAALDTFSRQPESVSFTDCIVMAFADEYNTKLIFGFDEVFKKNGYEITPKR